MNIKVTISYDGSLYKGSQKQPLKNTVEDELLKAFRRINIDTKIILSGRTDKEVHATGQVFNCLIPKYWSDLKKLTEVLNHQLPDSIMIKKIQEVSVNFHSRFHAKRRVYRYLVTTKRNAPFYSKYITYEKTINEKLISEAIRLFIGEHDFRYFHKIGSNKDITLKKIYDAKIYKYKDIYVFRFEANSYLRSQIRLMVGFLLQISKGRLTMDDLKKQLSLEKHIFKNPALPNGLYLAKVKY